MFSFVKVSGCMSARRHPSLPLSLSTFFRPDHTPTPQSVKHTKLCILFAERTADLSLGSAAICFQCE